MAKCFGNEDSLGGFECCPLSASGGLKRFQRTHHSRDLVGVTGDCKQQAAQVQRVGQSCILETIRFGGTIIDQTIYQLLVV